MKFSSTSIPDLYIIESQPMEDSRGFFERVFCEDEMLTINHTKNIKQINHSFTKKAGSVRGMHFQHPPFAEIKIVRCIQGSVFDVAVDIRHNSPTFLKWHGELLAATNKKMMYIPEGFAHGFQTLEDGCGLMYFTSNFYNKDAEGGIRYNDPAINIKWHLDVTIVSEKDRQLPLLDNFQGIKLLQK